MNAVVTKIRLKKRLRDELNLPEKAAIQAVDLIFEEIITATALGCEVRITGFGKFSRSLRRPRLARNPRTGELVELQERYAPNFTAGKTFRDRVDALSR